MKNFFGRFRWIRILYAIVIILVGITTTVFTFVLKDGINLALSITVSSTLFVIGLVVFLATLFNDQKDTFTAGLVYSSLLIALGVMLLMDISFISSFSLTLISIFLICFGSTIIFKGILSIVARNKWYYIAAYFVIGTIFIFYGILTLIHKDVAFTLTFVAAGVGLTIYGIVEFVLGCKEKGNKRLYIEG